MDSPFTRALDKLLRGFAQRDAAPPEPEPESPAAQREKWFADYAARRVMPLLGQAAGAVENHGGTARCWLDDSDGKLRARLEIVPPGLPAEAHPPRLTVSAADDNRLLSVDYTGTFPGAGASGGFGAEIEYDTIHPGELEDEILNFIAVATGA